MKFSDHTLTRYALSCVAAAMLAGCGGSRPPISALGTVPQNRIEERSLARMASSSGDALIYAFNQAQGGSADIFDYPSGKLVDSFQFSPTLDARGACSDSQGNVYLSGDTLSGSNIVPSISKYPYGATSPTASVELSSNGTALSCSVDSGTANVAAIVRGQASGRYSVAVWSDFQGTPRINGYGMTLVSLGYDGSGNLFLLGDANGAYTLAELDKGGQSFKPISLSLGAKVAWLRTVQWDGTHLTLEGAYNPGYRKRKDWPEAIYRLRISRKHAEVAETKTFRASRGNIGWSGTSWIQNNPSITVLATGPLGIWNYPPSGKELLREKGGFLYVATVAVSPSSSRIRKH
jgi:hypothetical protein